MKRRFLCGVSAAASLLLAICANAVTTTKNVDVVVTHGTGSSTLITTMTIQNGDPSKPIVPGASGYHLLPDKRSSAPTATASPGPESIVIRSARMPAITRR